MDYNDIKHNSQNNLFKTTENQTGSQTKPIPRENHQQTSIDDDVKAAAQKLSFLAQAYEEVMGK